jgi:hypothetical protein
MKLSGWLSGALLQVADDVTLVNDSIDVSLRLNILKLYPQTNVTS